MRFVAFTCFINLVLFSAIRFYIISKILISFFESFITEKRGKAKTMVVYKTQMNVLYLASFKRSIWIDRDKKYLYFDHNKFNKLKFIAILHNNLIWFGFIWFCTILKRWIIITIIGNHKIQCKRIGNSFRHQPIKNHSALAIS